MFLSNLIYLVSKEAAIENRTPRRASNVGLSSLTIKSGLLRGGATAGSVDPSLERNSLTRGWYASEGEIS